MRPFQSIHLGTIAATQFQHISETTGRDQCATRPTPFNDGIGGDGGAVQQGVQIVGLQIGPLQRGQQANRGVLWCRRHLQYLMLATRSTRIVQIGEGAAHIDAYDACHVVSCCCPSTVVDGCRCVFIQSESGARSTRAPNLQRVCHSWPFEPRCRDKRPHGVPCAAKRHRHLGHEGHPSPCHAPPPPLA